MDLLRRELRRGDTLVHLQAKPLLVLAALLETPGELVSRDELQKRLWPDGTHVEFEEGLNAAVARLRQALGDSGASPRFIETVPRQGYRFVAPVSRAGGGAGAEATPRPSARRLAPSLLGIGVAAVVLLFLFSGERGSDSGLEGGFDVTRSRPLTTAAGLEDQPSLSPDGTRVAYASDQLGQMDVWVQPLEASSDK